MNKGIRSPWLLAIAPAMLVFAPALGPFISLSHRFLYHQDGSVERVLLALWLNLAAAWIVFAIAFQVAARVRWFAVLLWLVLLSYFPLLALNDWAALSYTSVSPHARRAALVLIAAFLVFVAVFWNRLLRPRLDLLLSRLAALLGFASLSWCVTLAQLVTYTVEARNLSRQPTLHVAAAPRSGAVQRGGSPRVIWIIMDELGYDPAFAHRLPGLVLPAFDRMAAQSTQFTEARAPGLFTEEVIPEILMGRSVPRMVFTAAGALTYANASGKWQAFDPEDTAFGDALRSGYGTAIVGWFNPYCRLLAPVLDRCFWSSRANSTTADFDVRAPFLTNLTGPMRHEWNKHHPHSDFIAEADRREATLHTEDLLALLAAADKTLSDPSLNFVLLHLPVPHPSGIYDRRRGVLTTAGGVSYVDNLALADKVLAHLRDELSARGEWDSSAVLLMGDHSWRTTMRWEGLHGWTPEDQVASHGGGFDPRPVFLLKLPGQQAAATWDQTFPTIWTRALLDAVTTDSVRTPGDLRRWLAEAQTPSP